MLLKNAVRFRSVADPSVGVADLKKCLEDYLEAMKDNNLAKLLESPTGYGWKSAACPAWLCKAASLWKSYFRLAPNATISGKKHRTALSRLLEGTKANCTKKTDSDFIDSMDDLIRIGLNHLRNLKMNDLLKQRCFKKADAAQQEVLNEILQMVVVSPEEAEAATSSAAPTSTDLVPVLSGTPSRTVSSSSIKSSPKGSTPDFLESGKVFARVLRERESMSSAGSGEAASHESKIHMVSPYRGASFTETLNRMCDIDAGDMKILEASQATAPAQIAMKPKGKAKPKTTAKTKAKAAQTSTKADQKVKGKRGLEKGKTSMPEASKVQKGNKEDPEEEKTSVPQDSKVQKGKQGKKDDPEEETTSVPEVPSDAEIVQPEDSKGGPGDVMVEQRKYKTKERARVLSSAYHKIIRVAWLPRRLANLKTRPRKSLELLMPPLPSSMTKSMLRDSDSVCVCV